MTAQFIAKSMSEAIRAIADLRAELDIAYEHLHAAEAECDALRADAERWDMFAALWAACTELQATQDEDGRWSLTCIEPVEGVPEPGRWTGDNPDAAIDAARKEKP